MSLLSRFATAAVMRENERLRRDITVWRDRAVSAEHHRELANTQISNQRRVITEQGDQLTVAAAKTRHDQLTIRDLRATVEDLCHRLQLAHKHLDVCPTMQAIEDHDADKGRENAS